jgi:DNA processing protein
VPGNVTSRNSFGTNYLIKGAGAKLVQQWQDVAAELPPDIAARLLPPEAKRKTGGTQPAGTPPADLSQGERAIFNLLSADDPTHIDALIAASKLPIPELTGVLLALEMRELIRQLPGKCFVKKL